MTKQIWAILIGAVPPHPGFEFQPVEREEFLAIILYVDNFSEFSTSQQGDLATWITMLIQKIRNLGCPCYLETRPNRIRG